MGAQMERRWPEHGPAHQARCGEVCQGRAVLLSARPTGEGGCIQAVPEAVPAHPGRNQARPVASGGVRAREAALHVKCHLCKFQFSCSIIYAASLGRGIQHKVTCSMKLFYMVIFYVQSRGRRKGYID